MVFVTYLIEYILKNPESNKIISLIIAVALFSLIVAIVKRIIVATVVMAIALIAFNMMWGNVLNEANLVKAGINCDKVPCSRIVRIIKDNSDRFGKILDGVGGAIKDSVGTPTGKDEGLEMDKYIGK